MNFDSEDAAYHSDLHIYLFMEKDPFGTKDIFIEYGYVCSESPCKTCIVEIEQPFFRHAGWFYICPECKNYMEFDKLTKYYSIMTRMGKDVDSVANYKFINFHGKSHIYLEAKSKVDFEDDENI